MKNQLYKAKDIIGNQIISRSDGRQVGSVSDIVYDADTNRVESLVLSEGGWFSQAKVLKLSNVSDIGEDSVMIETSDLVMTEDQSPHHVHALMHENDSIRRKEVVTETGQELGFVTDIYFDSEGTVQKLEITPNVWDEITNNKQTINAQRLVTVGEDKAIIK